VQKLSFRKIETARPDSIRLPNIGPFGGKQENPLSHLHFDPEELQARSRELSRALRSAQLPGRASRRKQSTGARLCPYLIGAAIGAAVMLVVLSGLGRKAGRSATRAVRAGSERLPLRSGSDRSNGQYPAESESGDTAPFVDEEAAAAIMGTSNA
jgi:hypothetical protein